MYTLLYIFIAFSGLQWALESYYMPTYLPLKDADHDDQILRASSPLHAIICLTNKSVLIPHFNCTVQIKCGIARTDKL